MVSVARDRQLDEETDGLMQDFRRGLFSSNSSPALKAFKQLVCYLESFYVHDSGLLPDPESRVKRKILSFLLSLRVNHLGQIGMQGPGDECEYSPFVICGSSDSSLRSGSLTSSSSPPLTPSLLLGSLLVKLTELNLSEMVRVLLLVLEKEKDWQILRLVLMGLKTMISQNPTLITLTKSSRNQMRGSGGSRSIAGDIVTAAAQLIHGKCGRSPDQLLNTECPKFTKSEFDRFVHPLLESLIVYGKELDSAHQTELLKAIQTGLQNRSYNRHTMQALTSCLMEMQDPKVVKYLPELLLTISKISATKALAVPKMSFLSTLVLFPQMYSSFTADQYMSIFAIAIPYTNYSEFDEFTIALAHRVIAMWFLNCKLEARMQFASYIRKNLVRNLHSIASGDEDMRARSHSVGTSMKRSPDYVRVPQTPTPLHHQHIHPHHVPLPASPGHTLSPAPHSASSNTIFFSETSLPVSATGSRSLLSSCSSIAARETLHRELFEACMDLLSRYTHGMCSSVPRKNPLADFIIDRETAMTWFVGQSLITIAVSHCGAKAVEKGLCRKCQEICNSVRGSKDVPTTTSVSSDVESDNAFTCSTDSQNKDSDSNTRFSESQRRRHQSAIDSRRVKTKLTSRAYDDIHLETVSSVPTPSHSASSGSQNENCSCWCQGWAEITERRPTGKTSFMMRIENSLNLPCYASPAACDPGSYHPLVRIYDPRVLTHSAPRLPNSEATQQKSHTTSTNPETGLAVDGDSGVPSSCSSVRRTSSSPEIEHNRLNQFEDVEVEEAKEVKDDDLVSGQSPTKGLARTVSLGKAEMCQRPASSSPSIGNPVTRASSFSSKAKMMSPNRVTEVEPISPIAKVPSEAAISTNPGTTSGWTRSANKKSLTISLENTSNAVHMNGASGTASASSASLSLSPTKSKHSPKTPDEPVNLMSQSDSVAASGLKEGSGRLESPSSLRERSHTFSANTVHKKQTSCHAVTGHQYHNRHPMLQRQSVHPDTHTKSSGLSPSFFFLRLYYSPSFNHMSHETESPILLPSGTDTFSRNIRLLDLLTPFETHKIGVLYLAPGQKTRNEVLLNEHGSVRYQQMLARIANLVRLKDVDQQMCFIGGLDNVHDMDGKFAYCWADHLTQVVFHVATLMPTKEKDPTCNDKFRHIGNDFVWIVYNESGSPFCRTTLFNEKLPFLKVCIVITPLDCGVNNVLVQADQEMDRITGLPESFMISDQNLSLYVRQIAIHANLAYRQQYETAKRVPSDCMPFVSNWVERLRHMKRLRNKLLESGSPATSSTEFESISASGHRPRSMTTATRDSMTQQSSDGHDSEYPDYDFTAFTG